MNYLLHLFIIIASLLPPSDCEVFYKETLYTLDIKGNLMEKEETEEFFILHIKDETEKNLSINLIKNKTGKDIFNFAKEGCMIFKPKERLSISVVIPYGNGDLFVRQFPNLCE